ncbi:MAG: protein-L-isoaspartate(D-aspartate) O-methyltransferase [Candidatus Eisenbacteria sp.]|nr:protein-L-isoaspartate(D-aspartate) O-methyltransferase [Candidatus Eisenbacteria bacterium]
MRIWGSRFLVVLLFVTWIVAGCGERSGEVERNRSAHSGEVPDSWVARRESMVRDQIWRRGVQDPEVLRAMRAVPRHLFVPQSIRGRACDDTPLPIGYDQTISQPYIVALMTELLDLERGERVLEVGTGSGYQAAVLAMIVDSVYTIEIIEPLARVAMSTLEELGYHRVRVRIGDGYAGWEEAAPFDGIIVTCAPRDIPPPLVDQLAEGGRLVIPCGDLWHQELLVVEKKDGEIRRKSVLPVRFVPLIGPHGEE